jgi:phosphonoacetaldehyde hydrolase
MTYTFRREYRGLVRAVITDLAGSVIDHGSRAPSQAFIELFRRHGITLTDAQARGPMGLAKRDHIAALLAIPEVRTPMLARGDLLDDAEIDLLYAEFIPLQLATLRAMAQPIRGAFAALNALRPLGIRVAATTGYNREMLDICLAVAREHGFVPDVAQCSDDVRQARPAPWQIHHCLEALEVFPVHAAINCGDTLVDIEAGLNAGTWTVGLAATGNMLGLSDEEYDALPFNERTTRLAKARGELAKAGAHFVIDSMADIRGVVDEVNARLARGERP